MSWINVEQLLLTPGTLTQDNLVSVKQRILFLNHYSRIFGNVREINHLLESYLVYIFLLKKNNCLVISPNTLFHLFLSCEHL